MTPCPCCNSENIKEENKYGKWRIYCGDCGIGTGQEIYRTNAHMIWERRSYNWPAQKQGG